MSRNTHGVRTTTSQERAQQKCLGKHTREGESPVYEKRVKASRIQSSARHEESRMKERGPSRKAKYYLVTDREEYREGKVKRTPGGE